MLQDRLGLSERRGVPGSPARAAYIEPGSPWQNAYVESFNSRLRDEPLNVEVFTCLAEARALAPDWRVDYNATTPTRRSA